MSVICLSPNGADITNLQAPPDVLMVATLDGVVRLRNSGASRHWAPAGAALAGSHISSLLCDPRRGLVFAGAHTGGLFRSDDDGRTWRAASAGIEQENVFCLASNETAAGVELYAGTEPPHLYRSRDLGDTWKELIALRSIPGRESWNFPPPPHIAHVKHICFNPHDRSIMYVCIEQGALLKSVDGGETFHELHFQDSSYIFNKDAHRIAFDPARPDRLYMSGGDGIAVSNDAGVTWTRVATPQMRVAYPDHLYHSPDEDGVLYASGAGSRPGMWRQTGSANSAVVRSPDGGRTWAQLSGGLPEGLAGNIEAMAMVRWPGGFGFFAGTTDGEVYCSLDRGETWKMIASGLAAVSKCMHYENLIVGRAKLAAAG